MKEASEIGLEYIEDPKFNIPDFRAITSETLTYASTQIHPRKNPHALFLFYIVNHRYGEQRVTNQRGGFLRLKLYLLRSIFGQARSNLV